MTDYILIVIALELAWLLYFTARPRLVTVTQQTAGAGPAAEVEILQQAGDQWLFHSTRPEGHRDIAEALATPGLAIRRAGVIEKGKQ